MDIAIKSIQNKFNEQERIIESLKDIIQNKENEITKLWHENRELKAQILLEGKGE